MTAPMITATRTMDEMIKMITRLRVFRRNACCSSSPLKDLIVSIFDMVYHFIVRFCVLWKRDCPWDVFFICVEGKDRISFFDASSLIFH